MVFAREINDSLTSLVKKLDEATAKNKKLNSFIVFLGDDEGLKDKVEKLAEKQNVKNTILTVMDNPTGPGNYKIAKEADVTVVLYNQRKVAVNHAFRKGELDAKAIDRVVSDLKKIVPED